MTDRLLYWIENPEGRKPPELTFTAGPERKIADVVRLLELQVRELTERVEGARRHLDPLRSRFAVVLGSLKHLLHGFITYGERALEEDLKVRKEAESAIAFAESPWTEKRDESLPLPPCTHCGGNHLYGPTNCVERGR